MPLNNGQLLVLQGLLEQASALVQEGLLIVDDVPAGALWVADFKNGVYEVGGVPVALTDMFGENLDWSAWSPDSVVPGVGLELPFNGPTIIGDAVAAVGAGATFVFELAVGAIDVGQGAEFFEIWLYDLPAFITNVGAKVGIGTTGSAVLINSDQVPTDAIGQLASAKIALTLLKDSVAYSYDGQAVVHLEAATPVDTNTVSLFGGISNVQGAIEKMTAYPPQPNTALPALSEIPPPPTASAVLDFKNGVYTLNGAPVVLSDLVAENTDWALFDPAMIEPGVGLHPEGFASAVGPVFIGDILPALLYGATYVVHYEDVAAAGGDYVIVEALQLSNGGNEAGVVLPSGAVPDPARVSVTGGHFATTVTTGVVGANIGAATINRTRSVASLNGGAVAAAELVTRSPAPDAVGLLVQTGFVVTKVEIMPMVADADLPALSAG